MSIDRIKIVDRPSWLEKRKDDVTASAAGALLGVHPYVSAFGLYLLKAGLISEDDEPTEAMERGNDLEPVVVKRIRRQFPQWSVQEYPIGYYYRDTVARIGATPDLFVVDEAGKLGVIQIKTVDTNVFRSEWKQEDGSIEPPLWIAVQAVIEAHLTGADWAAVAAMVIIGNLQTEIIPIPIHTGVIDRIKTEVAAFWQRIEKQCPYPPDYARDGRLIASLYPRDNGKQIDLSGDNAIGEAVANLEAARAAKKLGEAEEKTAKAIINDKMQDAALAILPDGRMLSNKLTRRKGYFVDETEFRQLRILKGR